MQKIATLFGLYKSQFLSQTGCSCGTVVESSDTNSEIEGLGLPTACTEREKMVKKKFYKTWSHLCKKSQLCLVFTSHNFYAKRLSALAQW